QYNCLSLQVGKPQAERIRLCYDTSGRRKSNGTTACLQPATAGSLGLDLAAAIDVTLYTDQPTKIPTGVKGPIAFGALLLGRSSASILGLFVLPGVIDADYTGEIQIMAHIPYPPLKVEKGQRIAQLLPLPQLTAGLTPKTEIPRDIDGFGSTGLTLLTLDLRDRPRKTVKITFQGDEIFISALLDTGADTSIVSPEAWPKHWPYYASTQTVTGIGGYTLAKKSPTVTLHIDGQQLTVVFSIVPLPPSVCCLIG
ncbi:POK9 protein, partial [Oenanthe oenanthe]|nr:POK9 protein [Oenanthe oenanthe]